MNSINSIISPELIELIKFQINLINSINSNTSVELTGLIEFSRNSRWSVGG